MYIKTKINEILYHKLLNLNFVLLCALEHSNICYYFILKHLLIVKSTDCK